MNISGVRSAVDVVGGAGRISRRFDHGVGLSVLGELDLKALMTWLDGRLGAGPRLSEFGILVRCRFLGLVGKLVRCSSNGIVESSMDLSGASSVLISPELDSGHFLFSPRSGSCVGGGL